MLNACLQNEERERGRQEFSLIFISDAAKKLEGERDERRGDGTNYYYYTYILLK